VVIPIFLWVWISLSLLAHLWIAHRKDPFFKKLRWSPVICFPFFGWIFYGAFYTPLRENDVRAQLNMTAFWGD
jgi:hypothetical protein